MKTIVKLGKYLFIIFAVIWAFIIIGGAMSVFIKMIFQGALWFFEEPLNGLIVIVFVFAILPIIYTLIQNKYNK